MIGKQCFADKYNDIDKLSEIDMDQAPKWNFTDFVFSFLMVSLIRLDVFWALSSEGGHSDKFKRKETDPFNYDNKQDKFGSISWQQYERNRRIGDQLDL